MISSVSASSDAAQLRSVVARSQDTLSSVLALLEKWYQVQRMWRMVDCLLATTDLARVRCPPRLIVWGARLTLCMYDDDDCPTVCQILPAEVGKFASTDKAYKKLMARQV